MNRLRILTLLGMLTLAFSLTACGTTGMNIKKETFGTTKDGKVVDAYTLTNAKGLKAKVITYGATLTELQTPDRAGKLGDIVLGYDNVGDYEKGMTYFGCTTGRVANRIANAKFMLDGKEIKVTANTPPHHLHGGGPKALDKVVWDAQPIQTTEGVGVIFTYYSKDGDEGYPGNLTLAVTYMLTNADELRIDYLAKTDKATPVNLTNHSYFNMADGGASPIMGHQLMIAADQYTATDASMIPTGKMADVKGTPFDFTKEHSIGAEIGKLPPDTASNNPGGYDVNYVLKNYLAGKTNLAATVHDPKSGRSMHIYTTKPGIQFYTGNFLDGSNKGKGGVVYKKNHAFCLETQYYPDSVNQPTFPSIILKPGEKYSHTTIHKFFVR